MSLFTGLGNLTSSVSAGAIEFRLQIEGYANEFVTTDDLINETIGPVNGTHRLLGLLRDGLQIDETIFYDKGVSENRGGISFKIMDAFTGATMTFFRNPTFEAPIAANLLSTDTTVQMQTGYGSYFTSGSFYYIGNETLKVSNVSTDTLTIERGKFSGLIPFSCSYYFPDAVYSTTDRVPYITDAPITLRGRRVTLYAYSSEDDFTSSYDKSTGSVVYRGMITSDIGFADDSATTYSFTTDNILKILDGNLGTDQLNTLVPQGYYFPDSNPFTFLLYEDDGTGNYPKGTTISISGFYRTIQEFATAVNNLITGATWIGGSPVNTYSFQRYIDPNGQPKNWAFTFTTDSNKFASCIHTVNGIIKDFDIDRTSYAGTGMEAIRRCKKSWTAYTNYWATTNNRANFAVWKIPPSGTDPIIGGGTHFFWDLTTGLQVDQSIEGSTSGAPYLIQDRTKLSGAATYVFAQSKFASTPGDAAGTGNDAYVLPQQWPDAFAYVLGNNATFYEVPSTITNPSNKIYINPSAGGLPSISYSTILISKNGTNYPNKADDAFTFSLPTTAVATATINSITFQQATGFAGPQNCLIEVFNGNPTHNISVAVDMVPGTTGGNLNSFLSNLLTISPNVSSLGYCQLITNNDIDVNSISPLVTSQITNLAGSDSFISSFYNQRRYSFFNKSHSVREILAGEAMLLGCYFCLGDDGRITLRKMEFPSQNVPTNLNFTYNNILTDQGQPKYQRYSIGFFNSVSLHTGYQASKDSFSNPIITLNQNDSIIRNNGAVSNFPIKIYSNPALISADANNSVLSMISQRLVGILKFISSPYGLITIESKNVYFSASIGSVCSITNDVIPNYKTSQRGFSGTIGQIQAKKLDLNTGFASWDVVCFENGNLLGYTPTLQPTGSIINLGNGNYAITCSLNKFSPYPFNLAGNPYNDTDFFTYLIPNSQIELALYDDESGAKYSFAVQAISGVMSASFNAAPYQIVQVGGGDTIPAVLTASTGNLTGSRLEFVNYAVQGIDNAEKTYAFIVNLSESNRISKYGN